MGSLILTRLLKIALGMALLTILISLLGVRQSLLESARTANSFIDSIGVCIHLTYLDTAYGQYEEKIKPKLQELGIRHVRGDAPSIVDKATQAKFNDLAKIGIKSVLIMDPRFVSDDAEAVELSKSVIGGLEGIEGPNEWDVHPELEYQGENFPKGVRHYQSDLYSAIKLNSDTAHLPVIGPSVAHPQNAAKLGQVDCDLGNMHSYSLSFHWGLPTGGLNQWLSAANTVCGEKPIVATETGYHNTVMSEKATSKYLLRLFFEYFNHGIKRTYTYELIDLKPNFAKDYDQYHFGLLRYDGSPKPDFIALKNTIKLLNDYDNNIEQPTKTDILNYRIQGNTKNVHHTLLQKQNRNFYLILWQEVPSFDLYEKIDIEVSARPLKLILNTAVKTAKIYQPLDSTKVLKEYVNPKDFVVEVSDSPIIIELLPS